MTTYKGRNDLWFIASFALATAALLFTGNYWIGGPLLLVFTLCVLPQTYQVASDGVHIRAGLVRRYIPYNVITFVGPVRRRTKSGSNAGWRLPPLRTELGDPHRTGRRARFHRRCSQPHAAPGKARHELSPDAGLVRRASGRSMRRRRRWRNHDRSNSQKIRTPRRNSNLP